MTADMTTAQPFLRPATYHVAGLDLSITSTGAAIAYSNGSTVPCRVRSKGKETDSLQQRHERLSKLTGDVVALLPSTTCLVVVEGPSYASMGGHQHDRSGFWWKIVGTLIDQGLDVAEVPPSVRAKYATGRGNASKDEVLIAVVRRFPDIEINGNDTADAVTLVAMGRRHIGAPIDNMPLDHLVAMTKVRWPSLTSVAGSP